VVSAGGVGEGVEEGVAGVCKTAAVVTGGVGADTVGCFGEAAATAAALAGVGDGDGDGDRDGGGDASGDELHGRSVLKGRAGVGVGGGAMEVAAAEMGVVAAAHGGSHCVASVWMW
jgi:hypothetical protein